MLAHVRYKSFDQLSFTDVLVYSKLPRHPFWSFVEEQIDFTFADKVCAVLYSNRGQHPYAPSLKLKIHLVQAYYDLSDRRVEEKIMGDLFIKRFLGVPVEFFGFDHSTIGLDRSRMGESMFHACHLYILAQLFSKGLLGDKNEQWIIDSFPSNISTKRLGAYRLIKQAMIRVVQHVRRFAPSTVNAAMQSLSLDALKTRFTATSTQADRILAFSKLVTQAYGLLGWFEQDAVTPLLAGWKHYAKSQELQATLKRILEENSRPHDPDSASKPEDSAPAADHGEGEQPPTEVIHEKTPRQERPTDRVVNVVDPEVTQGVKNSSTTIVGYKVQTMCTTSGVILDTKVVPAIEHDREAMAEMVANVQHFLQTSPDIIIGDTAYGHAKQRIVLAAQGVHVVAPIQESKNPTNLYPIYEFQYDAEKDAFLCPSGEWTVRRYYHAKLEGAQYHFKKKTCAECPFRTKCTTNKNGRTVFRSDHADIYEEAKEFNNSDDGKYLLRSRNVVERKNNELKNDCGLGHPQTKSRTSLQIKSHMSAIAVNLKHMVRVKFKPKPGFLRRAEIA